VQDVPDLFALARPEAANAAAVAQLSPCIEIYMPLKIERRDEIVAALYAALREVMVACQLEAHTA
jgi:hypothetical protein